MSPIWQGLSFEFFGGGETFYLFIVEDSGELKAALPLMVDEERNPPLVQFTTFSPLTPYNELVISPELRSETIKLFTTKLKGMEGGNIALKLEAFREDSPFLWAVEKRLEVDFNIEKVKTGEFTHLLLRESFEDFFYSLKGAERKKLQKIMKRVERMADLEVKIYRKPEEVLEHMDEFFRIYRMESKEKFDYMTPGVEAFLREVFLLFSKEGKFSLYVLEADGWKVGTLAIFEENSDVFLYASGFDPQAEELDPSLFLFIKFLINSIRRGMKEMEILDNMKIPKLGFKKIATYTLWCSPKD